jgi:hypothetical protein
MLPKLYQAVLSYFYRLYAISFEVIFGMGLEMEQLNT